MSDEGKREDGSKHQTGQYPPVELGPDEKLEGDDDASTVSIPGAQSAESDEIKQEINPNTE